MAPTSHLLNKKRVVTWVTLRLVTTGRRRILDAVSQGFSPWRDSPLASSESPELCRLVAGFVGCVIEPRLDVEDSDLLLVCSRLQPKVRNSHKQRL